MDPEASIHDAIDQSSDGDPSPQVESAFDATWQPTDATLLQPTNLSIAKVQRGWERRPLSPFSKQRLRVGKVWKRASHIKRSMTLDAPSQVDRESKRRKAYTSLPALLKPVKKMCLDSHFGMAPSVLQWESVESPARKIVTRSAPSGYEMLALPDEDEDCGAADSEVDVTVEILDEEGTVLAIGGAELGQDTDWQDDTDPSHLGDLGVETSSECTTTPPDTIGAHKEADSERSVVSKSSSQDATEKLSELVAANTASSKTIRQESRISTRPLINGCNLPEGFISPAKRDPTSRKTSARSAAPTRRRTLPVSFVSADVVASDEHRTSTSHSSGEMHLSTGTTSTKGTNEAAAERHARTDPAAENSRAAEDDWEDVEDEVEALPSASEFHSHDDEAASSDEAVASLNHANTSTRERYSGDPACSVLPFNTDTQLLSSPVPTVEGPHPRLPLRRSPRRKSSSPLKRSTIFSSANAAHLIALTPMRGPSRSLSPSRNSAPRVQFGEEEQDTLAPRSPIERAASAPPEEPTMSPLRPARPRISDDTALLQAFLSRAAESRGTRRLTPSKQESITNRRDSDTVRQALASPAKVEVLADLDPNTPSPRKSANAENADAFDGIELGRLLTPEIQDDARDGLVTRRSDRASRRAQPQAPAAPNKIAIRGNAEYTVLKKTEAQELAILTRNNTRKNKGGSVLPPLRLTKLAVQVATTDSTVGEELPLVDQQDGSSKGRGVRWAEILTDFYQGGESSESSIISDELSAPGQTEQPVESELESASNSVPATTETPDKPRIRRLKPAKTASTPAKLHTDVLPATTETDTAAFQTQIKLPAAAKRRSRIATPAKGLTNTSFLPSDLDCNVAIPTSTTQGDRRSAAKKSATVSKLPAPLMTSTAISQGKENLISSPPKKRTGGPPSTKIFVPKIDLGNKTQLQPDDALSAPGLASPAKKGKWKGGVAGSVPVFDNGREKREEVPGLSSPAKKRTRRAV